MRLPAAVTRLMTVRLLRSLGQGALAVDFALYARALGWTPGFLGAVLSAALVAAAAATAIAGPLSDRHGRKPFLIVYEAVAIGAGFTAMLATRRWPLVIAAIAAGYGRGANGAPGLFGAVEQAWLARLTRREEFGRLYSRNTAVGFLGSACGALLAGAPALLSRWLPGPAAYRPLFALAALTAAICLVLVARTEDPDGLASSESAREQSPQSRQPPPRERTLLVALAGLNALNGIGIGLVTPLLSWWLAERYGAGPAMIGPALAVTQVLAAATALVAGRLGGRFGTVRLVVMMRAGGLVALLLLPLAPSYAAAMALYGVRLVLNRGSAGSRQALVMGLVRPQRHGLAAAVSAVSSQLPRACGPTLAGLLFGAGSLAAPFLLAALFQAIYLALYPVMFARHDPVQPRRR